MQRWRIEELDPPEPPRGNVVDPMERIAIAVVMLVLIGAGASAIGGRSSTIDERVATPPMTNVVATPSPYTFVMHSTGMASGGFWCEVSGAPQRDDPSAPPGRLIVIVSTDRDTTGQSVACVIPAGPPRVFPQPNRQ